MLHILLLILKIIGIIIAAILGILVLLICIVLFVPVRYEIMGKCDGTLESLKAKIHLSWLLHLVSGDVYYKNGNAKWRMRIAWIKRTSAQPGKKSETLPEAEAVKSGEAEEKQENVKMDSEEEKAERTVEKVTGEVKPDEEAEDELENAEREAVRSEKSVEQSEEVCKEHESPEVTEKKPKKSEEFKETSTEKEQKFVSKIQKIYERIMAWFQKIKCTFAGLCDRIEALSSKKDKLMEFIQDETHIDTLMRAKKEVFHLLKRLKPGKAEVNVIYGFEDPYRTGQVLAGLGVLYPFLGEYTSITPDFENRVLKGNVHIKGKIFAWHLVAVCWNLFWSKNVRTTYKHIKNFEL